MATYGTDLVELAAGSKGESGTWTEFVGWDGGGAPSAETENFVQGTQSQSQTFGNATGGKSICFNAGSNISASITTGKVVMGWVFMGAATNMYSYASGGHRFGIAADTLGAPNANMDMWSIGGDDRPPNPYGGWWNFAVDPRVTPDFTTGTGSGGVWWYFGSLIGASVLGIRAKIAKGSPHAVDGMLMGRGEIYCTGTGATFTLMAAANDAVTARWGLLQDTGGGTFLWKGLMSLGLTATSTTFSDSNKTIVIDDCPKTYAAFNKIEINNASSSVDMTNISFTPKGTLAPGNFQVVANATVNLTSCSFANMGTFIFQSNSTIAGTTFRKCGQITSGGANLATSIITGYAGTADTSALVWNQTSDPNGKLNNMAFTKGATSSHAIEFGTSVPDTITISGTTFTGYNASNGQTDSAILISRTSGTVTINIVNGGTPTYKSAGATVIINNAVVLTITVKDKDSNPIQNAQCYIVKQSDGTTLLNADSLSTGIATTTYNYPGSAVDIYVRIRKSSTGATKYVPFSGVGTITSSGYSLTVTLYQDLTAI